MTRVLIRKLIALVFAVFFSVSAIAAKDNVFEQYLENGLKVIVKVDSRAPVVSSQVWYRVGSSYEGRGITGVSHMLEHMMFKGTKKFPSGMARKIISENGGSENAFTSKDYTVYHQTIASDRLEICFELESDRMNNLILDEDEFESEQQVVLEERRSRTDDNPNSITYERFYAVAFNSSPYRNPVIGWREDIVNYSVPKLKRWYSKWYSPNNATLVVVGDVVPEEVFSLARKHFGVIPQGDKVFPDTGDEIEPLGKKEIIVSTPARLPLVVMGYTVPTSVTAKEDWEPFALEVLAGVLDGGDSSRFASRLIRGKEIAAWGGVGYSLTDRLNTQFIFVASPSYDSSISELKKGIDEEILNVKSELVSKNELDRVKTQILSSSIYSKDSVNAQAREIGMLESVGLGWRFSDEYYNKIKQVTPEQVMAVAKKYFSEDRLTVAYLEPKSNED